MISAFVMAFLLPFYSHASESVGLNCVKFSLVCPSSGGCVWSAQPGQLFSIALSKKSEKNSTEIWEGGQSLTIDGQQFDIYVYQSRKNGNKFEYLRLDIALSKDVLLSSTGGLVVTSKYHDRAKKIGVSVRCTTVIGPAPN